MTFAQFVGDPDTGVIGAINSFVVPVILMLAFMVFIGGITYYFFIHGGEEGKRAEGRQFILWGVIGLALLYGAWSVVNLLLDVLGIFPKG